MQATNRFRISSLAAIQSTGKWRLASWTSEEAPAFYALTKGQGRVVLAGRTRGLNPPCYLFIPARHAHRFEFSGQVFGTKLRFDRTAVPRLPTEPILLRGLAAADQRIVMHHLSEIERERGAGGLGSNRAIMAYATLLTVAIERAHQAAGATPWSETKSQRLAARFMTLIEEDIANGELDGPSVQDYATRLDITATHLTRVCQSGLGQGASSYLQDRLLSEARRRLKETEVPVQSIARDLGYRSAAYFSRAYGARMGQTPSASRQEVVRPGSGPH